MPCENMIFGFLFSCFETKECCEIKKILKNLVYMFF